VNESYLISRSMVRDREAGQCQPCRQFVGICTAPRPALTQATLLSALLFRSSPLLPDTVVRCLTLSSSINSRLHPSSQGCIPPDWLDGPFEYHSACTTQTVLRVVSVGGEVLPKLDCHIAFRHAVLTILAGAVQLPAAKVSAVLSAPFDPPYLILSTAAETGCMDEASSLEPNSARIGDIFALLKKCNMAIFENARNLAQTMTTVIHFIGK
jgi:hypothetical protein